MIMTLLGSSAVKGNLLNHSLCRSDYLARPPEGRAKLLIREVF